MKGRTTPTSRLRSEVLREGLADGLRIKHLEANGTRREHALPWGRLTETERRSWLEKLDDHELQGS